MLIATAITVTHLLLNHSGDGTDTFRPPKGRSPTASSVERRASNGSPEAVVLEILALIEQGRLGAAASLTERSELDEVDRSQLLGYISLLRKDYAQAVAELRAVVRKEPHRRAAWLHLAVAHHHLQEPEETLEALEKAESAGVRSAQYFALKARALRLTRTTTSAYEAIVEGRSRFEDEPSLLREEISLLVQIGATETARTQFQRLLVGGGNPLEERLWFARALTESGELEDAAAILESARLEAELESAEDRPVDAEAISAQLAWTYAQLGNAEASARLLDPQRLGSTRYAFESADQYRLAGTYEAALRTNRYVSDPGRRINQRLLVLVEAGRYEQATAFGLTLPDPALLDDTGRFALAFALAATDRRERARKLLAAIEAPEKLSGFDLLQKQLGAVKRTGTVEP